MAGETDAAAAAPAGNNKLVIILLATVVVLLIGGGAGAFFMLSGKAEPAATAEVVEEAIVESTYIDLKPEFVINFRDRHDRPKFLKAEMSVAAKDSDMEEVVQRHMPAIRNNLVLLLSRQVYDDLVPHEGKEALRLAALAEVQGVLEAQTGKPGVDDLFFSNFVMH